MTTPILERLHSLITEWEGRRARLNVNLRQFTSMRHANPYFPTARPSAQYAKPFDVNLSTPTLSRDKFTQSAPHFT
jgi:hypothetical protein